MAAPFGGLPSRFAPSGASAGTAFVLPGRAYSPSAPLLEFARQALLQHGFVVHQLWWDVPGSAQEGPTEATSWVAGQLAEAVRTAAEEETPLKQVLVIGKSLGTRATAYVAEQGWPAIWLTPLLDEQELVDGILANPAPQLVVGGLADPLHDSAVAAELAATGRTVLEVPDADHCLWAEGDAVRSAEIQLEVAQATEAFLSSLGRGGPEA